MRVPARPAAQAGAHYTNALLPLLAVPLLLACARGAPLIDAATSARGAAPSALERRFLDVPARDSTEVHVRRLAARPHLAGTPGARETADSLAAWLERLGFEVEVEHFEAWLPHPGRVEVTLSRDGRTESLSTREPFARIDIPDTASVLTSWLAYGANARAEAPIVYANYGLPADYAALERASVDVRGAIVLARFGGAYRGVKVFEAEARGAAGVLLYPDPAEDGYARGDTVPVGAYRPSWSVQRGTVMAMWRYTGDPLTPGRPAMDGEPRLAADEATNLPRIPATTIGYADAARVLAALDGPAIPEFRGALDVPYRTGPGAARIALVVEHEFARRPIHNVIAHIPGETAESVVLGNHFDAWVAGGADPHTGTAAMLEIARGLAALRGEGWRPRRGITLAFWDAEEFGVIGSTEWVEKHATELARDVVAYFNIDMFTAGVLDVTGTPALRDLVVGAAHHVDDPITGRTLAQEWRDRQRTQRRASRPAGEESSAVEIGDIGAGSDWTAFLHHVGIPSLQWTMNGRGRYAVYHSALDDALYYEQHVDSAFVYTPAVARVMGLAALRLADTLLLPFDYRPYAARIADWLGVREREAVAAEGHIAAIDFEHVRDALAAFTAAAEAAAADAAAVSDERGAAAVNERLRSVERAFLVEGGLRGRPWYRHILNAPGAASGYGPLPLPELAEAIEASDAAAASLALDRIAAVLLRAAAALR